MEQTKLELIRHDAAHVMAMSVQELYPETKVTIGPVIENGFFYDFARETPFTEKDLEKIEKKMKEIVNRDVPVTFKIVSRKEAIEIFSKIGENYKVEIINSIPENEEIKIQKIDLNLSKLIQKARFDAKISQKGLAEKLNLQLSVSQGYESGKVIPNKTLLYKMGKVLNVHLTGKNVGNKIKE